MNINFKETLANPLFWFGGSLICILFGAITATNAWITTGVVLIGVGFIFYVLKSITEVVKDE